MTDYSKMSDFEINKRVLKIKSELKPLGYAHDADKRSAGVRDRNDLYHWYDFCNSWADAGPIIQSNRLYVDPIFISDWCVTTECDTYREIHKNPLRAAMVVFLMMKESENVS